MLGATGSWACRVVDKSSGSESCLLQAVLRRLKAMLDLRPHCWRWGCACELLLLRDPGLWVVSYVESETCVRATGGQLARARKEGWAGAVPRWVSFGHAVRAAVSSRTTSRSCKYDISNDDIIGIVLWEEKLSSSPRRYRAACCACTCCFRMNCDKHLRRRILEDSTGCNSIVKEGVLLTTFAISARVSYTFVSIFVI